MRKRFWLIIGFIGGLAIAAALLVFVWLPSRQLTLVSPVTEEKAPLQKGELEVIAGYKKAPVPGTLVQIAPMAQWTFPAFKEPEFKPFFQQEEEKFSETFLERFSVLANSSIPAPKFAPDFFPSQPISTKKEQSVASAPEATSTEIILSLTDDEFHFLYPDDFIASLMEAQNFIKEYDPDYVPLAKIETDSQVRFIEEKLVAAFLSVEMISKEEAERAITTIRFTLPQLQLMELKNRKSSSLNELVPINACLFQPPLKGLFFAGLIEKLYSAFFPEAQAKVCGHCYSWAPCFQVGASNPAVGTNTFATFCYCTGCYWYAGCLSRCSGQSAIWDPLFLPGGTGICGCG